MAKMSRRALLNVSSGIVGAAAVASGLPQQAASHEALPNSPSGPDDLPEAQRKRKLKVVFVGAHADDWTVCGGTLASYARAGHEVLILSFTPGDSASMADVYHMTVGDLAAARRDQATKGAQIIGAAIKFLKERDLQMRVDPASYQEFNALLAAEKPDVVFAMWLMEFHPDHRAAGNLAYNAWLQSGMTFGLYFCETPGGTEMQPQQFIPTHYFDVGPVRELRRDSFLANALIKDEWPASELWAKFRGMEYGCQSAEAFVRVHTVATMPERNLHPNWWYWGGLRLAGQKG
jgi:LmbE family N-acetylglucosaminyl deacetylase